MDGLGLGRRRHGVVDGVDRGGEVLEVRVRPGGGPGAGGERALSRHAGWGLAC